MLFFFFQAEDGIRDYKVTGVQTCALPISHAALPPKRFCQFALVERPVVRRGEEFENLFANLTSVFSHASETISVCVINDVTRSEERRVGKECRSRWSPYH